MVSPPFEKTPGDAGLPRWTLRCPFRATSPSLSREGTLGCPPRLPGSPRGGPLRMSGVNISAGWRSGKREVCHRTTVPHLKGVLSAEDVRPARRDCPTRSPHIFPSKMFGLDRIVPRGVLTSLPPKMSGREDDRDPSGKVASEPPKML